jgi:integrase
MKVDVYKLEQRYRNWKEGALAEGIPRLSRANSDLLIQHVLDMEEGRNVARGSRKGGRSYTRLVHLQQRLKQLFALLQARGVDDVSRVTEDTVLGLIRAMERGELLTRKGTRFLSTDDYVRDFKAFWHWHMRVQRRIGVSVPDLTAELSAHRAQPRFVYLRKEDVDALLPYFTQDEQVLLLFLFDSVIRAPTEVLSLRAGDVYEQDGEVWAHVPDDASKTFGRSFNLLYCGQALRELIARRQLRPADPLFAFSPPVLNRKLKEAARVALGDRPSHAQGDSYANLSLYDFRHSGAIHLRLLAKDNPSQVSLDAIRHRAGWTDFTMLNYYTRFIGLDGKIERTGTLLQQDRSRLEHEVTVLRNQLAAIRAENTRFLAAVEALVGQPLSTVVREAGGRSRTLPPPGVDDHFPA